MRPAKDEAQGHLTWGNYEALEVLKALGRRGMATVMRAKRRNPPAAILLAAELEKFPETTTSTTTRAGPRPGSTNSQRPSLLLPSNEPSRGPKPRLWPKLR